MENAVDDLIEKRRQPNVSLANTTEEIEEKIMFPGNSAHE